MSEKDRLIEEEIITKCIVTRTFEGRIKFEKLILGEEAHNLGYDQMIGEDFSWRRKYCDKYDNIIIEEQINTGESGDIEVFNEEYYYYYDPSIPKLDSVISYFLGEYFGKQLYIREKKGKLIRREDYGRDKLEKKEIFEYNQYEQRVSYKAYRAGGIEEKSSMRYSSTLKGDINPVEETYEWINYGYTDYIKNTLEDGLKTKIELKRYRGKKEELLTEEISYFQYHPNNILRSRKVWRRSQESPIIQDEYYFSTDEYLWEYDKHGHCIEYSVKNISDEKPNSKYKIAFEPHYTCAYEYNSRGDWINANLVISGLNFNDNTYIVIRDISYY